jgi:hypothetical protein
VSDPCRSTNSTVDIGRRLPTTPLRMPTLRTSGCQLDCRRAHRTDLVAAASGAHHNRSATPTGVGRSNRTGWPVVSTVDLPNGWTFTLAALTNATGVSQASAPSAATSHPSANHPVSAGRPLAMLLPTLRPPPISNGTFQGEVPAHVGNGDESVPLNTPENIGGRVVAVQGPGMASTLVLQFHASVDAAWETPPLDWHVATSSRPSRPVRCDDR